MITKLILALSLIGGCTNDQDKVKRLLERDGYTDVVVGGWSLFGCDKNDTFTNTFKASKASQQVNGWVCSGWLKGMTIRIDD